MTPINELSDNRAIAQVLGCLILKPDLLNDAQKFMLDNDDFPQRFHKIVFASIKNLYDSGIEKIDIITIDNFLSKFETQYNVFNENKGLEYLDRIVDTANLTSFKYNFDRMKKFSLLRDYTKRGIDISFIYDTQVFEPKALEKMQRAFDGLSIKDIVDKVDEKLLEVKDKYLVTYGSHGQQAGENMEDLVEDLKKSPAMGAPLSSMIFNALVRGARLKKLYMRSAPTGVGKFCPLV